MRNKIRWWKTKSTDFIGPKKQAVKSWEVNSIKRSHIWDIVISHRKNPKSSWDVLYIWNNGNLITTQIYSRDIPAKPEISVTYVFDVIPWQI